jgi:hypothetical protein
MQTQAQAQVDFNAYQWPPYLDEPPPLPDWCKHAALIGDLRISDDLGHIRTPEGELTISPGDWLVQTSNGLFAVWSNDLYHAFMSSQSDQSELTQDAANIEAARRVHGDDPTKWPGWDDNRIADVNPNNAQREGDNFDQPDPDDVFDDDPKAPGTLPA